MDVSFYRNNDVVWIKVDSNLGTCKPIFHFGHQCKSQEEAELLVRHFRKEQYRQEEKYLNGISEDPECYLVDYQLSRLKRKLKKWDMQKYEWKD